MKIGEVSKLTGLSISNIRFYEKKGLLSPKRDEESKYREYSETEIDLLNRIVLYRKMDVSVETIEAILKEEISVKDALEIQLKKLEDHREQLDGAICLCEEMISHGEVDAKDIDYYLNFVKQEETKGHKFMQINDILSDYTTELFYNKGFLFPEFYVGRFNLGKGLRMLVAITFISLPVIFLIDLLLHPGDNGQMKLIGVIILLLLCWGSFFQFMIKNKSK